VGGLDWLHVQAFDRVQAGLIETDFTRLGGKMYRAHYISHMVQAIVKHNASALGYDTKRDM
jgi:hypothetical protein